MPEKLQESLADLQVIFQTLGEAVFVQDRSFTCIYSNDLAAQVCGFKDAQEFIGSAISRVVHNIELLSEDRQPFPPELLTARRVLMGEEMAEAIYIVRNRVTGTETFAKSTSRPIRNRQNEIIYAVTIFRNITEDKLRERHAEILMEAGTLFSRSLQLDDILQSLGRIVVPRIADLFSVDFPDENGLLKTVHVVHRNPEKLQIALDMRARYHSDPKLNVGPYHILKTGEPQLIPSLPAEIFEKVARNAEHLAMLRALAPVSVLNVPLLSRERVIGVMSLNQAESLRQFTKNDLHLAMDISARFGAAVENSRLYESLQAEKKNADRASSAKSLFLANMSHEIRTPMNAILGFSKLLRDPTLVRSERDEFLDRIVNNGDHLLHLIDDILDLSRVEAGQMRMDLATVAIKRLLQDVHRELEILIGGKNVKAELEIQPDLPDYIEIDPVRIKQILINLLSNAAKFTFQGVIAIRARYLADAGRFRIDVSDTGIGIPPASQEKLFNAFSQGDTSITRKYGGTGLGLVLSRRIAELMKGSLQLVESIEGSGSLFRLDIPLQQSDSGQLRKRIPDKQGLPLKTQIRILLADDAADNRALVKAYLRHSDVSLVQATTGIEAVEALQSSRDAAFDLVLMDMQMPEMDGLEATRRIRNLGYKGPVIALTAHALPEEMQRSLDAGCNSHLTKPISRDILLAEIGRLLPT